MIESKVAAEDREWHIARRPSYEAYAIHGVAMHVSSRSVCLRRPSRLIRSILIISVMNEGVSVVIHGVRTVHTYRAM